MYKALSERGTIGSSLHILISLLLTIFHFPKRKLGTEKLGDLLKTSQLISRGERMN